MLPRKRHYANISSSAGDSDSLSFPGAGRESRGSSAFSSSDFVGYGSSTPTSQSSRGESQPPVPLLTPGESVTGDIYTPNPASMRIVCFGMIHDVRAKVVSDPNFLNEFIICPLGDELEFYHFKVIKQDENFIFSTHESTPVASLNERTILALSSTAHLDSIEFRSYCSVKNLIPDTKSDRKAKKEVYISVDINICGRRHLANEVSKNLNSVGLFLQHPDCPEEGLDYENPHSVTIPGLEPSEDAVSRMGSESSNPGDTKSSEESERVKMRNEIALVFSSLSRSKYLKLVDADRRIKTPLLQHQKEALDFMSQREFGPVPSAYSLWQESIDHISNERYYEHILTGTKSQYLPSESGGGILADDMGLGKTLTLLSVMVRTSDRATDTLLRGYGTSNESKSPLLPARATLVIVPSEAIIKVWIEEIRKHIYGGLTICLYHGRGRETNAEVLAKADIVLTTYYTVAPEGSKASSVLFQIKWFRIVLDEAHKIRTISTKLYKTASRLEAELRWCMTGTPVQNSLDDIGSLVSFLRIPHLSTPPAFKKSIIDPLIKGTGVGSEGLRLLLDSICLRRSKRLLDLPDVDDRYRVLTFSDAERVQYDTANAEMSRAIIQQANMENSKKGYFGIFQLEMRLRRLCNHGTYQKLFNESPDEDLQIEPKATLAPQSTEYQCQDCKLDMSKEILIDNLFNGHFTTCGHLLCSNCVPNFEPKLSINKGDLGLHCPICQAKLDRDYILNERPNQTAGKDKPESLFEYFRSNGYSSKVQGLLDDIKKTTADEKCIIFSGWTRSLDLIGYAFAKQDIKFHRIDGFCSPSKRNKILEDYRRNSSTRILMMTTGVGAEGLNLAVANCVFILEPQWNPMVECQAIARVSRLGQKNKVKVIRYIMAGTVETTMRSQQSRKLALADIGWRDENAD